MKETQIIRKILKNYRVHGKKEPQLPKDAEMFKVEYFGLCAQYCALST